jgi:hypothetical protein
LVSSHQHCLESVANHPSHDCNHQDLRRSAFHRHTKTFHPMQNVRNCHLTRTCDTCSLHLAVTVMLWHRQDTCGDPQAQPPQPPQLLQLLPQPPAPPQDVPQVDDPAQVGFAATGLKLSPAVALYTPSDSAPAHMMRTVQTSTLSSIHSPSSSVASADSCFLNPCCNNCRAPCSLDYKLAAGPHHEQPPHLCKLGR